MNKLIKALKATFKQLLQMAFAAIGVTSALVFVVGMIAGNPDDTPMLFVAGGIVVVWVIISMAFMNLETQNGSS